MDSAPQIFAAMNSPALPGRAVRFEEASGNVCGEYTYSFPEHGPAGFHRDVVLNHRLGRDGRLNPDGWLEGLLLGLGRETRRQREEKLRRRHKSDEAVTVS